MKSDSRFEFRIWTNACHAQGLARRLEVECHPKVEARRDIYFLIDGEPDLLAKLRGERRLEIKQLCAKIEPFQQWATALHCDPPYRPSDISTFNRLTGLTLASTKARQPQQVEEGAALAPACRLVTIDKTRRLWTLQNVQCEVTEAALADRRGWSVAFEGDDLPTLRRLAWDLDILEYANVHYGVWLRRALRPE